MREILFRGQTRRYGEKVRMGDGAKVPSNWVYGGVLQGIGSHSIIYGGENANDPSEGLNKWVVYTDTLGQFTGLTDKNGKKIFEGDVLEWYMGGKNETPTYGYVVFDEADLSWCVKYQRYEPDYLSNLESQHISVVGNIYDNPEYTD